MAENRDSLALTGRLQVFEAGTSGAQREWHAPYLSIFQVKWFDDYFPVCRGARSSAPFSGGSRKRRQYNRCGSFQSEERTAASNAELPESRRPSRSLSPTKSPSLSCRMASAGIGLPASNAARAEWTGSIPVHFAARRAGPITPTGMRSGAGNCWSRWGAGWSRWLLRDGSCFTPIPKARTT